MSKETEKQLVTTMKLAPGLSEGNRLARALRSPGEQGQGLSEGQEEETETFSPD